MDKLRINLIPPEIKEKAKKDAKSIVAVRISIGLLGLLILLTAGILGVIIFQSITIKSLNTDIESQKTALVALKDKEAVVYFLKNRIDTISKFATTQHTQNDLYVLITSLIPEGIKILSLQIDKSDLIVLQGETGSSTMLENFFNNLTDPQTNDGKITSVTVDSLNKGQTGVIKFNLTLKLAK